MDYKRIIKSRSVRLRILQFLSFVPDELMIKLQYRLKTGRKLNLNEPQRFTEKIQWYKLHCRSPLMRQCVNKYIVREYVKQCGCGEILVPLLGIYDSPDDICYDSLPNQFVIKDTLGGGGNSVEIVRDKTRLNTEQLRKKMSRWVRSGTSYKIGGREWPYGGQKHQILIEALLPSDSGKGGLIDYKFFCSYGKVKVVYIISDRAVGQKAQLGIYTPDFQKLEAVRLDELPQTREVKKPPEYGEMCKIAEKLSVPFPEVRIDLYDVNGRVYFGEVTFFDGSGYMAFSPDDFDKKMGELFPLKSEINYER